MRTLDIRFSRRILCALVGLVFISTAALGSRSTLRANDWAYDDPSAVVSEAPSNLESIPAVDTPACDAPTGGSYFSQCGCESNWLIQADALFLHRCAAAGYGVLYDANNGTELLNAASLGSDTQAGLRLTAMYRLASDRWLDVEYFGIDGWSSTAAFGPGNLFLIGDQSRSGPPATTANFLYASRLYTVEANIRGSKDCWIQPLVGFRWVRLGETYNANGLWDVGLGPLPYDLNYHTQNDLYGGQIGANADLWQHGQLSINAIGKAGVYLGHSTNAAHFDGSPITSLATNSSTDRCSFFGELGLNATWRFNSTWAIRGGYQVYWLDGVAIAPDQVLSTDLSGGTGGINANGSLFLHGAHVGLEASW